MNSTETMLENVRFLAQTRQLEYADYERFKAVLAAMPLTESAYNAALKQLCEVMGI